MDTRQADRGLEHRAPVAARCPPTTSPKRRWAAQQGGPFELLDSDGSCRCRIYESTLITTQRPVHGVASRPGLVHQGAHRVQVSTGRRYRAVGGRAVTELAVGVVADGEYLAVGREDNRGAKARLDLLGSNGRAVDDLHGDRGGSICGRPITELAEYVAACTVDASVIADHEEVVVLTGRSSPLGCGIQIYSLNPRWQLKTNQGWLNLVSLTVAQHSTQVKAGPHTSPDCVRAANHHWSVATFMTFPAVAGTGTLTGVQLPPSRPQVLRPQTASVMASDVGREPRRLSQSAHQACPHFHSIDWLTRELAERLRDGQAGGDLAA